MSLNSTESGRGEVGISKKEIDSDYDFVLGRLYHQGRY